jgi:hypothetical protein
VAPNQRDGRMMDRITERERYMRSQDIYIEREVYVGLDDQDRCM